MSLLVFSMAPATESAATLIGGSVLVEQRFPDLGRTTSSATIEVQEGPADATTLASSSHPPTVDIEDDSILIQLNCNTVTGFGCSFGAAEFNGLVFTVLQWPGATQRIVGVTLNTSLFPFQGDRVAFTEDSVSVNFTGPHDFNTFDFATVHLETLPVPEPSTAAHLAAVGVLMGCRRLTRRCS